MNSKEISVRLPEPLFLNLTRQAESTGTTLEEVVVFALTRQTTPFYEVGEMTDENLREQQRRHEALIQSLKKNGKHTSYDEAKKILSEREQTELEPGLDSETIRRIESVL